MQRWLVHHPRYHWHVTPPRGASPHPGTGSGSPALCGDVQSKPESLSFGPRPLMKSCPTWPDFVSELLIQDTREFSQMAQTRNIPNPSRDTERHIDVVQERPRNLCWPIPLGGRSLTAPSQSMTAVGPGSRIAARRVYIICETALIGIPVGERAKNGEEDDSEVKRQAPVA